MKFCLCVEYEGESRVADEEDDKDELYGGADGVVLVARLHVADQHGRAGHLLEGKSGLVKPSGQLGLGLVQIHGATLDIRLLSRCIRIGIDGQRDETDERVRN